MTQREKEYKAYFVEVDKLKRSIGTQSTVKAKRFLKEAGITLRDAKAVKLAISRQLRPTAL